MTIPLLLSNKRRIQHSSGRHTRIGEASQEDEREKEEEYEGDAEQKSTVLGATCNLINAIIGAAVVGIPYAMKQTGLGSGLIMIIVCAFLTEKSLRLLIETAKHVGVSSYELLFESCFGRIGFTFISLNMLIMSYGALVGYLLVIKDTLPILMGIHPSNDTKRIVIVILASLAICLPLSSQRDVAHLAKTSKLSVIFDIILVSLVIWFSPISENVASKGGYAAVISPSGFFKPPTFFIGLGVLSFAYVCQHASFVIAGSLQNPTNDRWSKVTKFAVITCGILLTSCGVIGYLGFQDDTQGNILNSFLSYPNEATTIAANIARGLLCCAVFFVYPIESFVARHVLVVLLFKGRRAHSGDDHAVLARNDVRWAVTIAIYACALTPALLVDDLGSVYSMTGVVAASFLSYVGPGAAYLAVHGSDFLTLVRTSALWNPDRRKARGQPPNEIVQLLSTETFATPSITQVPFCSIETMLWYVFLMPLWVQIAQVGEKHLLIFKANEALKSPLPSRLGKAVGSLIGAGEIDITPQRRARKTRREVREYHSTRDVLQLELPNNSVNRSISLPVDAVLSMNISAIRRDNAANVRTLSLFEIDADDLEISPQRNLPTLTDFLIAIGYMLFGAVALCAGLLSILKKSSGNEAS